MEPVMKCLIVALIAALSSAALARTPEAALEFAKKRYQRRLEYSGAELEKAKQLYARRIEDAAVRLLSEYDRQISSLTKKGQLEMPYELPEEYDVLWIFETENTAINFLLVSPKGKRFE
jgi:hypothetical protein